ncbi:MAG: bacillithiol biosynthesis protein BshC [Candidatus Thorarchaeota archaeon]
MEPSIVAAYDAYIWRREHHDLVNCLYDSPPVTLAEAASRIPEIRAAYDDTEWFVEDSLKKLQQRLAVLCKRLGCMTPGVKHTIERLGDGAVEAAHQSANLGGPAFILNKAATAVRIVSIANENRIASAAYFCVADYDEVQPELTHVRTPLMGHEGNVISVPVLRGYEHSPVSALPRPSSDWYEEAQDSIREGYRPLFKSVEGHARGILEERLEQALSLTRWAFFNSSTLGEWALRILGRLLNVEGRLGLPLFSASDPELRRLLARGFEMLLRPEVRKTFLASHRKAGEMITASGFRRGVGDRDDEYVPFFHECVNADCHRARTRLIYNESGNRAVLYGECPLCGEKVEIEVTRSDPDLSDVAVNLSPRVDSRQFALDAVIPVVCHVGGPGEAAYYAQVIPAAMAMGAPFPTFVRYPRMFFNTPWSESLARTLAEQDVPVLHGSELFRTLGRINKFRKKKRHDEMNAAVAELGSLIRSRYEQLNDQLDEMEEEIQETAGRAREQLLDKRMAIERYLSWTFGAYAPGKQAQEASWSWIEWVVNAGFPDMFGPYERAYVGGLRFGATLFTNFIL